MTLDELVVKLVLDVSGFAKGQRDAADAMGKLKQGVTADAKATEEAVAKVTSGVEALGRRFLGLYALVTAGRGLREFVSDLTSADSALGRTAKNIDLGAKALSTWQLAAEASGGSAAGITGVMRSLSGELQRAALTGTSSIIPAFKALGITLADSRGRARDVRDILTDMNRRAQGMDPAKFTALANLAGISDEGTISMLEMKTEEFDKLIAAQEKYATTQADVDAAQKRQTGWRELLITSTSIGRTILTAVTPALLRLMEAVQEWADSKDWSKLSKPISDFVDGLTNADWKGIIGQAEDLATKVLAIATAADDAAKGIDGNSVLFKGLEAMGALIGVKMLGSVVALTTGLGRLAGIPVTGMLARILMNPVLAGTLGVGALLASGDPDKSVLAGGRPDVQPQDNDLGLPGGGERGPNDTSRPDAVATGVWNWLKKNALPDFGKAYAELKATGFNDHLGHDGPPAVLLPPERPTSTGSGESGDAPHRGDGGPADAQRGGLWDALKRLVGFGDDPKVKENVEATAKATGGIFDLMRNGANGVAGALGFGGVTASSGGTGGSGHHADGSGAGASLRDRQFHGKGNFGQKGWWTPERQSHAVDYLVKNAGLTEDGAKALVARWRFVESAGGPTAVNPKSGATGIGQWLGDRKTGGYNGTFDEQLQHAADELNGKEGRAKRLLNTPGIEANGASAYERAEGWNARTNTDNFTGTVREGMKHIAHGASAASPQPQSPASAPTSDHVTDVQVQAARARLVAGQAQAGDHALIARYLKEQNTPPAPQPQSPAPVSQPVPAPAPAAPAPAKSFHGKPKPPGVRTVNIPETSPSPAPTLHHVVHAALVAIGRANKLLHHDGVPVPVDVTERGASRIAHPINEALRHRLTGAHRAGYNHSIERAMDHASSIAHMHRTAGLARHVAALNHTVHNVDNSSATTIANMTVHTKAENGRELAADLERHLARNREVQQYNSGLA